MLYKIVEYATGDVHLLFNEDDEENAWELDQVFNGPLAWDEAISVVRKDARANENTVMREVVIAI